MLVLVVLALIAAVLAAQLAVRAVQARQRKRRRRLPASEFQRMYDPGRERRAERRARELLCSCVNEEEWAMYRDLGFIRVAGSLRTTTADEPGGEQRLGLVLGERVGGDEEGVAYAYLIYPHKPLVAYVPETGRLLSEYCVEFPDLGAEADSRLPASDDVLAKWMALTSDETRVVADANMHLVGHQLDPGRVRRDIWRLGQWRRRRSAPGTESASTS